ncbi:MAG: PAS domain-containing protein, partial [Candidatus Promineifilaceae bacterium]
MGAILPREMLTHLDFRTMPIAALLRSDIIFIAETTLILILVALLFYLRKRLRDDVLVWSEPYGKRGNFEKALQESQERLALVLEASDLGLWDRDIASGHTEFNARWAEMLGYKRDEIEGSAESWRSRIHAEDRARVVEALQAHLEGDSNRYEAEYRVIGK